MKCWQKFVPSLILAVGTAVIPGLAQAQNYSQDFSATFPAPVRPGKVTVLLTNEFDETIAPFVDFEVQGLNQYVGRPQFAARTGGANANQSVSAINATYSLGGVDTDVVYEVDPLPETGGNGAYDPDTGIIEDDFITLSEDGIGNIQSAVAWDEQYNGDYDKVDFNFVFQISGVGDPGNDQADGLGFAYLSVDDHGDVGVIGPGTSEEPNFAGSFGVGLDIWDNGGEGGNSVSIHHAGTLLQSIPIDPGTMDPNTGEDWEFNSFETDEFIQARFIVEAGAEQTDETMLKGGSQFAIWNRSGPTADVVPEGDPADMQGFLRVAEETGSVANVVAFDWDGTEANTEMTIDFDWRGLTTPGSNRADGMSFLLVPTDTYDETGADLIDFGPHEEPNLAGAFGVGFDTFNNDTAAQDDPEDMPNTGNHISLHYDAEKLLQENYDLEDLDLVTDDPDTWHHAKIEINGDDLTITITDGTDGSEHVISETIDGLSDMGTIRPAFAARTGGSFDNYDVDNFIMFLGEVGGLEGDYNMDGTLNVVDIDLQSAEMKAADPDLAKFDHNDDGVVDINDRTIWVKSLKGTWIGDSNFDNEFNSGDLVQVFAAGKYETGDMAGWAEGDWDGDMQFGSGDLVFAFADGGYEQGPAAVAAVPEPSSIVLLLLGTLLMIKRRRR